MHPVIKNILARKGKTGPFDDGRHITLVLPGGAMAGVVNGAGCLALQEMGLGNAFDEIYAVSAGFANACYFVSGQGKTSIPMYWEELDGRKFLNFWRFWKVADVDYVVRMIRDKRPLDVDRVLASRTKLFTRVANRTEKRSDDYLEVHDIGKEEFFNLLRAAISIPFLASGGAKIKEKHAEYGDVGLGYDLDHFEVAWNAGATDILVINNFSDPTTGWGMKHLPHWDSICQISPKPEWEVGLFETRPEKLKAAALGMGAHVKEMFGDTGGFKI